MLCKVYAMSTPLCRVGAKQPRERRRDEVLSGAGGEKGAAAGHGPVMESADSLGRGPLGAEWVLAQGKGEARTNQSGPYSRSHRNQKAERPLCNSLGGKTCPARRLFIVFYLSPLGVNIHGSPCRSINVPDCWEGAQTWLRCFTHQKE